MKIIFVIYTIFHPYLAWPIRNTIIEEIIQLIEDLDQSHSLIVENADNHINDNDIILTANYSDQLHEFF